MRRLIVVGVVATLLLGAGHAAEVSDLGEDAQTLQGAWRGAELEIKGDKLPPTEAQSLRLRFTQDTFTIKQGGKITVQGRYVINPASQPKTIDLTITETVQAVNQGAVVLGIYSLEKNQLQPCTTKANDQERPKKLTTKPGIPHSLFTFLKEKP